ncbi:hypothetical protein V7183_14430 [Bacillus sp. JJ1127]|uniref:hypothetical protein n=1 Tax=Bacillus sp. JJ1127 TaxID=3122952 RepID=UPI002FFD9B79
MSIQVLLFVLAGCFFIWIGMSMLRKRKTPFIAGYNTIFHPKNEVLLAKRIAVVVILFGLETILFPIASLILKVDGVYFAILTGIDIAAALILIIMDQMEV